MDYEKEITRRDTRIDSYKKEAAALKEEITGLRQLLDCAVANLILAVKDRGGEIRISPKQIRDIIGKYRLLAKKDEKGVYLLELRE